MTSWKNLIFQKLVIFGHQQGFLLIAPGTIRHKVGNSRVSKLMSFTYVAKMVKLLNQVRQHFIPLSESKLGMELFKEGLL